MFAEERVKSFLLTRHGLFFSHRVSKLFRNMTADQLDRVVHENLSYHCLRIQDGVGLFEWLRYLDPKQVKLDVLLIVLMNTYCHCRHHVM